MDDLSFSDILDMQHALWERNQNSWRPLEPKYARESFLWMMEELGEAIAIIKKKGDTEIMENSAVRTHFTEEIADMLMYLGDVLMRYEITPQEIASAYEQKHTRDLSRNFVKEHAELFAEKPNP